MLYNKLKSSKYIETAGKITIAAAVSGILVFAFVFLFNAGKTELLKVEAQDSATTTLTVLNVPPQWVTLAYEATETSSTSPTNSGDTVTWNGIASDTAGAPYFLIICNTATATANAATSTLGTNPPTCGTGNIRWAISTSTVQNTLAIAATTTVEAMVESNAWFGFVCDDDFVTPRCNATYSQGLAATNSSPFNVNHRPVFTTYGNNGPVNPAGTIVFHSTSSDTDSDGGDDALVLHVCNSNDYNTTTNQCGPLGTIATTAISIFSDATATYTLATVVQDDVYNAYGYIVDQHGHEATGGTQGTNGTFTVNNIAPTVASSSISLNGGNPLTLGNPAGETSTATLSFITSDSNSCVNVASTSEVTSYQLSVYRSGVGSSTCNGAAAGYNPNNCYPSGIATSTWNLSCTASTTSCTGSIDPTQIWNCTFPLWFVADPTDVGSQYATNTWFAYVAAIDDDNATGTASDTQNPVELLSFPAIDVLTATIPYGALEPAQNSGTLNATTTVYTVGNTGLNEGIEGESMCITFAIGNECTSSASSTVPEDQQQFATSSIAYGSGTALSSSTVKMLDIRIQKSTSTTTPNSGVTYWGIGVPASITLAGAYTGLNTFYSIISSSTHW